MTRRPPARNAFTLVELLVVIAIIAILLSLISPAVQKIRGIGPRTTAIADIQKLSLQCDEFNRVYKFYPPTQFRIPAEYRFNTPAHPDAPGCEILQRMFPRWGRGQTEGAATGLPNGGAVLIGGQCLVYFLGGPSNTGWAVDAPVAPSVNAASKNVFFDFPPTKLVAANSFAGYSNALPLFIDPWNQPYVYHGSVTGGAYPVLAVNGVAPFTQGVKFVNAGKVQIISAGENQQFGPGGAWTPGIGPYSAVLAGGDDLANFNDGKRLGTQN